MQRFSYVVGAVLLCSCLSAFADLVPPRIQAARERLSANPDTYDRVDKFCQGKKPEADCWMPGSSFAGGGAGKCRNNINDHLGSIDMSCVAYGINIERDLPPGGFVDEQSLCDRTEEQKEGHVFNCTPLVPIPMDRFCRGKQVGSKCTVEGVTYQDKNERTERHDGVCKLITETEKYYFQGYREAKRDVIQCEPAHPVEHVYTPAHWRQKLFQ